MTPNEQVPDGTTDPGTTVKRPPPLSLRIDARTLQRIELAAANAGMTRNAWIVQCLLSAVPGPSTSPLATKRTGKTERSGDGRQRGGVAAAIRLPKGYDPGRCSECGSPGNHQKWCGKAKR